MNDRHAREIAKALRDETYDLVEEGLYLPQMGIIAKGQYHHTVNGEDLRIDDNMLPDQALTDILGVYFGALTKKSNWYIALFSGQINPAANWSASNFAATANEITSGSQGYSQATRPAFTPAAASANTIGNLASKAQFSIVCSGSLSIEGAALLSDSGKGATSGVLGSAARYAAPRIVYNGDTYEVGYTVSLTS